MEFGVVLLHVGARYGLEILALPVNLERPGDGIFEAFVALENLKWTGNPTHGKESCMSGTEYCVGIGQTLPVREPASTSDAQSVESCTTDGNCICRLIRVKAQRS